MTSKDAAQLYRNVGLAAPADVSFEKPAKYNARKKEVDGHVFDSTGEAEAYRVLKLWESSGAITNLELQPRYLIQACTHYVTSEKIKRTTKSGMRKQRDVYYVPDFRFTDSAGKTCIVDFKGCLTHTYKVKRAIFREIYTEIDFQEWTRETLRGLR